jgi:hypothetical protein
MLNNLSEIRIFIGSSSEARDIAGSLSTILRREGFVAKTWYSGTFYPGEHYFESIKREVILADYAILVVTPEDKIVKRGKRTYATNDNVLLELGMFIGVLGIIKVFYLSISDNREGEVKEVPLPSDLKGIKFLNVTRSHSDEIFNQDLANICTTIKDRIIQLENATKNISIDMLPSESLAFGYFNNFLHPVCTILSGNAGNAIIKILDQDFDPNKDTFEFNVIIPEDLDRVSVEWAKKLFKGERFKKIAIEGLARNFPFYIDAEQNTDFIKLYDYPTTLRSSKEAIDEALKNSYYNDEQKKALKRREIRNFQRTLKIMLEKEDVIYKEQIKFISPKEIN